jgi:S1-C subfamily serine protease
MWHGILCLSLTIIPFVQARLCGINAVYIGGDMLAALDGQSITSLDELSRLLESNYQAGDSAVITLWREGREVTAPVTLAEEPLPR